ncbi:MAG: sensor histidine kinase [Armatimonadota bacterium]
MEVSRRLERLILYHLWASVPFGLAWAIWPGILGISQDPQAVFALRVVCVAAGLYLAARSWVVLRPHSPSWHYVWPLVDVALVTAALAFKTAPERSWISLLYLLPVTEAAATLRLRWAVVVGLLAAGSYLSATGAAAVEQLGGAVAAFRLFFLVLMASLLAHLARAAARAGEELAVSRYRNELSREMHDGIQHYLAAISTRLQYARSMLSRDPLSAARLAVEQCFMVNQAADELRYLVRRLRSPVIEREGFLDGLRSHLDLFGDRLSLAVSMEVEGEPVPLPPDVEQAAFRIIQEALTNAEKHAGANSLTVGLDFTGDALECVVADDGVGFDPSAAGREPTIEGGVGLHSMRERAASVGGTLSVESRPGRGTRIVLGVPVARAPRDPRDAEAMQQP